MNSVFDLDGYQASLCFNAAVYQNLAIYDGPTPKAWIEIRFDADQVEKAARYALLFGMDMWDGEPGKIAAVFDHKSVIFVLENRQISVTRAWHNVLSVMLGGRKWILIDDQ